MGRYLASDAQFAANIFMYRAVPSLLGSQCQQAHQLLYKHPV